MTPPYTIYDLDGNRDMASHYYESLTPFLFRDVSVALTSLTGKDSAEATSVVLILVRPSARMAWIYP